MQQTHITTHNTLSCTHTHTFVHTHSYTHHIQTHKPENTAGPSILTGFIAIPDDPPNRESENTVKPIANDAKPIHTRFLKATMKSN